MRARYAFAYVVCSLSLFMGFAVSPFARTPSAACFRSPLQVTGLKTEHASDPLGIETQHPRFRWLLESAEPYQLQTAYQILVATSPDKLRANIGDMWDSGKLLSDNSVEVSYRGGTLASAERAYWKVRVWDRNGRPSAYSRLAFFEMGLLHPSDWRGKWIAAEKDISSPLFRREFSLDVAVRRARVYVSGVGYYELFINGNKVSDRVLDPATTYYHNTQSFPLRSRVLYTTYDITNALRVGANAMGLMLGHGWYSAEADARRHARNSDELAPGRIPYGDRPKAILQMKIELVDGRTFNLVSDSTWKVSDGPITYNDFVQGELYDARLEHSGWTQAGFKEAGWKNAILVDPPDGTLTAEVMPPIRVIDTLPVVRVIHPKEGGWDNASIYDFGQHFSGWARITVSGPRGAKVLLRYGARIYPDSHTLDIRSNGEYGAIDTDARQVDAYTLKGEGEEIWEPRFTLHGFRYVEIAPEGLSGEESVRKVEGRVVHSAVESTSSFSSSNELLNKIHRNIQWTFASSLQGIPQDAADRAERIGWLGDVGFTAEDYLYNYDMVAFWEKWLWDIQDTQRADGSILSVSPPHWGFDYRLWPAWQSTYPLLMWYLYHYCGDRAVLADHYDSLKRLVEFTSAAAKDDLVSVETIGDHVEPQDSGVTSYVSLHTPLALPEDAYYYEEVALLARIADVLGRLGDVQKYRLQAERIKRAFNGKYFNPITNQYATGSQTSNALPLYLGLVPKEKVFAVMKNLVDDIVKHHDIHVSTGVIGTNALVELLPKQGEAILLYQLANQATYPSLGYQVTMGATTVCEEYECGPSASQNMKMFGSWDKFFFRNLAGIEPLSPGYRRVLIQPLPLGDLRHVSASQKTMRGLIRVEWTRADHSFDLEVSIPAGIEADIAVPKLGMANVEVRESDTPVWKENTYTPGVAGLIGARANADAIIVHAGSRAYHFNVRY